MASNRPVPLCSTQSGTLLPLSPPALSLAPATSPMDMEQLLDNPPDLICPITHELFSDPVINAAGQVYERRAIEACLARSNTDPVTRLTLPAGSMLTPVWIVKSRALEYREATARKCVEKAFRSPGPDAIVYLRRAAELCGDANFVVPGLSRSCMQYVQTHPSSSHDAICIRLFAAGLLAAGLKDEAAGVYYSLLHGPTDRAHQAELLKQCLSCWSSDPSGCPSAVTFQKLAGFIQSQTAFSWGSTIEVVQAAGFGEEFVLRLCEELVLRQPGNGDQAEASADWNMQKEVLMKYVKISLEGLADRQQATDVALSQLGNLHQAQQHELERQQAHQQQAEQSKDVHTVQGSKHGGSSTASKKPWHRTWPVTSAAWMVGSLVATKFPAYRPAQDLLLVYLLRKTCH